MALSRLFGGRNTAVHKLFYGLILKRVYVDVLGERLIFLSSSPYDFFHEKMVSYLSSVVVRMGLSFVRLPFESRYSGYDLELKGLNVEFESGLKASYRGLEDRIALSRSHVVIVVPNEEVRIRYMNHFCLWNVDVISLLNWFSYLRRFYK